MTDRLKRVVQLLPKAELHLHLRGAMPLPVLAELLNRHDLEAALACAPQRLTRRPPTSTVSARRTSILFLRHLYSDRARVPPCATGEGR